MGLVCIKNRNGIAVSYTNNTCHVGCASGCDKAGKK
jgi:hypothetical protein